METQNAAQLMYEVKNVLFIYNVILSSQEEE
jgi:hypothetical protein